MKKAILLNAPLSGIVADMGHGDLLCIGDAGLPVPSGVEKIDLAVTSGVPGFVDVLSAVTSEMFVERVVIANEFAEEQPHFHAELRKMFAELETSQKNEIALDLVSHGDFKATTQECRASVRTGECTPYANIILYAGVAF